VGARTLLAFVFTGLITTGTQAFASPGCSAVNSGSWNISVTGGTISRTDNFSAGDQLHFTFSVGDPQFNGYAFTGALSGGGGSFGGTGSDVSFAATAGSGTLTLTSNVPFGGISPRTISVASATCTPAVSSTVTTVGASPNPSTAGQVVTFTATVSGASPTGTVTFFDGGTSMGVATLSGGQATLAVSSLILGSHFIGARYNGDASNTPSTSPALLQAVNVAADSVRLRAMQAAGTQIAAQGSGVAISGAIEGAVSDGFDPNRAWLTPNASGFRASFAMLAQPATSASDATATDVASPATVPRDWLAWIDVRSTGYNHRPVTEDLKGDHVSTFAGLTRRLAPDLLVGVLGGHERFDYTSQALSGRLRGDGWTVGTYLGWRLAPDVRGDGAITRSGIHYTDASGAATGEFSGRRWLVSGGLTGTYSWDAFSLEPTARIHALQERENGYVDSLGTQQPERKFTVGRASGGAKAIYSTAASAMRLAPYIGLYGDYYFSSDNASTPPVGLDRRWSARISAGVAMRFIGNAQIELGGERGGIGTNTGVWTWSLRGHVPF
jgi:hypothetical protein